MAPEKCTTDDLDELRKRTINSVVEFIHIRGTELPIYYKNFEKDIEDFEVRDDDVWVSTFPKAGTTWTQEMVWCIANDLDFEKAKDRLSNRFPFLEICSIFNWNDQISEIDPSTVESIVNSIEFTKNKPSPRFIKTHLPIQLLPRQLRTFEKKPKLIYVTRNAKDSCISFYHHYNLFHRFTGTFDEFCKLFLGDKLGFGSYWNHIKGYWEHRDQDNILFLKYEDMKADLPSAIKKVANFLNKKLDDQQVELLAKHVSFESMKKNPAVNLEDMMHVRRHIVAGEKPGSFIRKGQVGQWKEDMPKEFIEQFDKKNEEYRKETGYDF